MSLLIIRSESVYLWLILAIMIPPSSSSFSEKILSLIEDSKYTLIQYNPIQPSWSNSTPVGTFKQPDASSSVLGQSEVLA
jgi:hypothetical protein